MGQFDQEGRPTHVSDGAAERRAVGAVKNSTTFHLYIAFTGQMVYTYGVQRSEHRQTSRAGAYTVAQDCVKGSQP
jgi:hypothetical protein